jgi:uncharacterized protein (DUF1697 family)
MSPPQPKSTKPGDSYVALLRGINVGGKNMLPMKELIGMFEREGCANVRNYIQSGNVVFEASAAVAKGVPDRLEKAILRHYKYAVPVLVRSAGELESVTRSNPFLPAEKDTKTLHVAFLASPAAKPDIGALDPKRSPGDEFVVKGREIFLRFPNGVGKSKLTNAYFDAKLRTTSTIRNWATVLKLLEMARG